METVCHDIVLVQPRDQWGPHSLGKLIEWKHKIVISRPESLIWEMKSPLAGETN